MTKPTGVGRGKAPGSRQTQLGAPGVEPKVGPTATVQMTIAGPQPTETASLSADSEPEDTLEAMKYVAVHPKGGNESHYLGLLRKWLDEDFKGFMNRLVELEKSRPPEDSPDSKVTEDDPGSDRAELQCDEWLRKHGVQPGEQQ